MPKKCCVRGCKSNYYQKTRIKNYVPVFSFPKDSIQRQAWLKSIPQKDWTPSKLSVVCIKHFLTSDYKSGKKCERIRLVRGAVPSSFEVLPEYKPRAYINKRIQQLQHKVNDIQFPFQTELPSANDLHELQQDIVLKKGVVPSINPSINPSKSSGGDEALSATFPANMTVEECDVKDPSLIKLEVDLKEYDQNIPEPSCYIKQEPELILPLEEEDFNNHLHLTPVQLTRASNKVESPPKQREIHKEDVPTTEVRPKVIKQIKKQTKKAIEEGAAPKEEIYQSKVKKLLYYKNNKNPLQDHNYPKFQPYPMIQSNVESEDISTRRNHQRQSNRKKDFKTLYLNTTIILRAAEAKIQSFRDQDANMKKLKERLNLLELQNRMLSYEVDQLKQERNQQTEIITGF